MSWIIKIKLLSTEPHTQHILHKSRLLSLSSLLCVPYVSLLCLESVIFAKVIPLPDGTGLVVSN